MKIANVGGRAAIVTDAGSIDIATATDHRFGPDPHQVLAEWAAFRRLVTDEFAAALPTLPLDHAALAAPVPRPRQVFGIGLNYAAHAAESNQKIPRFPATFTKFPASITGPQGAIAVGGDTTDWEVELVVVIGVTAWRIDAADAWDHVAGLTAGQDLSDRRLQFSAGAQFSLGKSRPGFSPIGPWLVTPDELSDPDDLGLRCAVNGTVVQDARTSDLVVPVAGLVAKLSSVLPLGPGDLIFTGTPSGIGATRQPPQFLRAGDVLETTIEGIGSMRHELVA